MIHKDPRIAALCIALAAFAAIPALARDADSTPGPQSATTWIVQPAATMAAKDAGPDDVNDAALDDFDLFTVPEPAALAMLAAGLLGIAGIGHRWRRR